VGADLLRPAIPIEPRPRLLGRGWRSLQSLANARL
jgi:hypothetical protein